VEKEYNAQPHATTGFPPCWLMYGVVPMYGFEDMVPAGFKPNYFTTVEDDLEIAYLKIKARADRMCVKVNNTGYLIKQRVLVQLCSRSRDAQPREWQSVAEILSMGESENKVWVRYLNTNVHRPQGLEEEIDVKHLKPIKNDIDLRSTVMVGSIIGQPHLDVHNKDVVVYIHQLYLYRKLTIDKDHKHSIAYLLRYAGESHNQAGWVHESDIKSNQLSHVESLVCAALYVGHNRNVVDLTLSTGSVVPETGGWTDTQTKEQVTRGWG